MYEPCKNNCKCVVCSNPCCKACCKACCNASSNKCVPICFGIPPSYQSEVKFSSLIRPSFLIDRIKQTTGKPKQLPSNKIAKASKTDKSKDKVVSNEKHTENNGGKRRDEQNAEANPKTQANAPPESGNNENLTENTAQESQIPFIEFSGPSSCPFGSSGIRAAGLPSKQCPKFDPCTGKELVPQVESLQQSRVCPAFLQNAGVHSCHCLNYQSYPSATEAIESANQAILKQTTEQSEPPLENSTASSAPLQKSAEKEVSFDAGAADLAKSPAAANSKEKHKSMPKTRIQANKANAGTQAKASKVPGPKGVNNRPNSMNTKEKSSKNLQIINFSDANPDLIDRICKTLQVPRPPESCYLLLPITMTDKVSKSDRSERAAGKRAKGTSSNDTSEENSIAEENSNKPTRNCGCNTMISGNLQDNSQAANSKNSENEQTPQNCYGPCCSAGNNSGACCWPSYSYYYNPCTGCYCWYKNLCYCSGNTCCNNFSPIGVGSMANSPPYTNTNSESEAGTSQKK